VFIGRTVAALAALCLLQDPAHALVGTVDEAGEFPYVVELHMTYPNGSAARCSGVVHGHLISTAAHCLYDEPAGGLAERVWVAFTDPLGDRQKAYAVKLYVPQAYKDAMARQRYDFDVAVHDIGYAVLDREALTDGYLHWGLELLMGIPSGKTDCAEPECMDWSLTGERRTGFLQNLAREVGDLSQAKVRVVGYGNYRCADYGSREKDCTADGKRRYIEMPLEPNLTSTSAPWLWCTGRGGEGHINPIQHGDSGGPVFVQALDGRWLYVGYTSGGNADDGCASSMFNEINMWRNALVARDIGDVRTPLLQASDETVEAWQESAARQFFGEWLRNETAPVGTWTTDNLMRLYIGLARGPSTWALDSRLAAADFEYHGRKTSFNDIAADKRRYIIRWPERTLTPSSVAVNCEEHELHNGDTCTVSALLDWTVSNGDKRLSGRSSVALTLQMPYVFSKTLLLLWFTPTLKAENGTVLSRGDGAERTIVRRIRGDVSGGYVNLREGPGQNRGVLNQIPAGQSVAVSSSGCVLPDDGVSKYPFCPVVWNNQKGWVSASGFE
jgi:hypothetical protein